METQAPFVSRRVIGKVNIFDLMGTISGERSQSVRPYIEGYIRECHFNSVIVNVQSLQSIDEEKAQSVLDVLKIPKKAALFFDSPTFIENSFHVQDQSKVKLCRSQKQVLSYFGRDLVENDKTVEIDERRKGKRIKTALDAHINFVDKDNMVIHSEAIITNLSEHGLFAEYLNLKSSMELENLDYFRNLRVDVSMQNPDLMSDAPVRKVGRLLRIEFTGQQTGIAVQFIE